MIEWNPMETADTSGRRLILLLDGGIVVGGGWSTQHFPAGWYLYGPAIDCPIYEQMEDEGLPILLEPIGWLLNTEARFVIDRDGAHKVAT